MSTLDHSSRLDADTDMQRSADTGDAAWALAERRHENTFLRLVQQVKNWRLFGFFCLGVAAIAVCGNVYIGAQSKYIPYVVEVDKLGQTVAVKALSGEDATMDPRKMVYREMFDLMENLRTVTTDRLANDDRIEKGLSRLDGAAATYVRTELRKAKPNDVGATKSVQVKVKTALKLAGRSWQVEWEEHSFNLNGDAIGVETWRATVQYELIPSTDVAIFQKNPMGFTVNELSWQKVN